MAQTDSEKMAEIMKSVLSKYKKADTTQSLAVVSTAPIAEAKVEKAAPAKVITPVVKPVQAIVEVKAEVPKALEKAAAKDINKNEKEHIEIIAENATTNEVDIDTDLTNQQEVSSENKLE